MAELGETTDPLALIPGNADAIGDVVVMFAGVAETCELAGNDMRGVRLGDWIGVAATAADERLNPTPAWWYDTGAAASAAGGALDGYASTLRWAQGQALEAIALWQQAAEADLRAAASAPAGPLSVLLSPGVPVRAEAREKLARAREQLDEAGNDAVGTLLGWGPAGADVSTWLSRVVDIEGDGGGVTDESSPGGGREWIYDGTVNDHAGGVNLSNPEASPLVALGLGTWSTGHNVWEASESGTIGEDLQARAQASLGTQTDAALSLDADGLHASIEQVTGLRGSAELSASTGLVDTSVSAEGSVGTEASAGADIGPDGVGAEAGLFAGVEASVEANADVAGIGGGCRAEARAGAGADAEFGIGIQDGVLTVDGSAGAAIGLGAGTGCQITLDPEEMAEELDLGGGFFRELDRAFRFAR
ncbi:hypothetical protein EV193_103493 [Herbihabitans rhizosphaerae]|uniref:Putative T7SS secretion signal domain-containing protein n=1 Tax=Herbihabitans rhizosphaerae TaxID=1872711 RepID=A0A4V2ETI3_9PSEU|nr:hypothetical protein [Herbihabitans rhizosphaerae]RZS41173.1 hypothetical protein EV193_103493 [Herbihabitans rhizosphaerae]